MYFSPPRFFTFLNTDFRFYFHTFVKINIKIHITKLPLYYCNIYFFTLLGICTAEFFPVRLR